MSLATFAAVAQARPDEVLIAPGDALSILAQRYEVSVDELRVWNGLDGDHIEAGRTLRLVPPDAQGDGSSAGARVVSQPSSSGAQKAKLAQGQYEVKPGDTLSGIASRSGASIADIVEWNSGLDPDRIYAGQVLWLVDGNAEQIEVAPSETLTSIARYHHVSIDELVAWNPGLNPNRIRVGQTLRVFSKRPKSPSESVGLPFAGRLKQGERLGDHPGWVVRDGERAYGTNETVRNLRAAFDELRKRYPDTAKLEVHDLSLPGGGPINDHASHQSGRDVDVALVRGRCDKGVCDFRRMAPGQLEAKRQWALFYHWLRREQVEAIYLDYSLIVPLYREAKRQGASADELSRWFQYPRGRSHPGGTVRHQAGHQDHAHVRFACHRTDAQCQPVRLIAEEARLAREHELSRR